MPFKPGTSGNLKGRPKGAMTKVTADVKTLARQYGPESVLKLATLMRGQDELLGEVIEKILKSRDDDTEEMRGVFRQLLVVLTGRNVQNELGAAKELLDRGYGRPAQNVDIKGGVNIVVEIVRFSELTGPAGSDQVAEPMAAPALPVKALALP